MRWLDVQSVTVLLGVVLLAVGAGGVVEALLDGAGVWSGLGVAGGALVAIALTGSEPPAEDG